MASKSPAQCCTIGVKFEGDPSGRVLKVAGRWDAYLASPPEGKNHAGAGILLIPDVIGIWANSKLIADQFAANGYTCLVIDEFNGDALALSRPDGFDFMGWITNGSDGKNPHTKEHVDPIIEAAIKSMKSEHGISKLGAVGYCFGAKYVARHFKSGIDVGYMAHPSFVDEEEVASITGPLSIAAAETDAIFTVEGRHKTEDILRKNGNPFQINLFSGVSHGFAVRGDASVKQEKFAKEQAFYQAVAWFDEYLL